MPDDEHGGNITYFPDERMGFQQRLTSIVQQLDKPASRKIPALRDAFLLCLIAITGLTWQNFQLREALEVAQEEAAAIQPLRLRNWEDFTREECLAIREEAKKRFARQAVNVGQGVDWRPVVKWPAEEKGALHTNVRELFR